MYRKCIIVAAGLLVAAVGAGVMSGQDKTAKGPNRDADKLAIEKLTKAMIQAFNNRDAVSLATHWTTDGDYSRNDGEPIRGQANILKGYIAYFRTLKSNPQLDVQIIGLRFPSADTAVSEVVLRQKNDKGEPVASSWRHAFVVREGGEWKVAMIREWDRDIGLDVSLSELDWLIGTWQAATKEREVTVSYEWDENKAFIRGKFAVKEGGKVVEAGTQMIGKDNAEGAIRSWAFQSDGGFAGGIWTRDGNKWSVDVYGVMADGKELTATNTYIRLDPNAFTWQASGQALNGIPFADTQPLKVTKQKVAK